MWRGLEQTFNSGVQWLYNQLEPLITPISAALEGASKALWTDLNNFLKDPVGAISSGLTWLRDRIAALLAPIKEALEDASPALWSRLEVFLRDPVAAINSGLMWVRDQVSDFIDDVKNKVSGIPQVVQDNIVPFFTDLGEKVSGTASWITDQVSTMFDGAVTQIQDALSGAAQSITQPIQSALQGFWNWIIQNMSNTFSSVGAWLNMKVVQPVWSAFQWLWNWITNSIKGVFDTIVNTARTAADRIKAGDPTAALEILTTFAGLGLATQGIMSIAGLKVVGTGIEVGEIGHYVKDLLNPSMITGAVIGTLIGAAVRTPLTQYYNMTFRNQLPDEEDLKTYFLRGYIDEAAARDVLARYGLADTWIDAEIKSWWIIPGVSDLINFVVKEVITPDEFYDWAAKQGLSRYWAENYWEAHWQLPSFGNLREAFWRGIITEDEFRKYIVWHDYKPEPRPGISKSDQDIIAELSYELPGRIDARWMFEQGAITFDQLKELYAKSGLHPDWLDATVEATARAVLRTEIETLVREAMYDYRDGWLTREEFIELMETLGLAPKLQEYWLARADMLAEREIRDEQYKIFLESFRLGIIDETTFREELKDLGMREDKIERTIYLEQLRKLGKTK